LKNRLCELVGVDFPLFAFSHCRDVVAAVSKAGGFGVFGTTHHTPEELEIELNWIEAHCGGRPYGVDLVIPENLPGAATGGSAAALEVPKEHRRFVVELLHRYGVPIEDKDETWNFELRFMPERATAMMDVAFRHPIRLIASALGVAPQSMIERGRDHRVPVAALVGAKEHAIRQVNAGVDVLVAQGTEAGGHCGEVSTLVLVPEVVKAVAHLGAPPVLAAGGIMNGRQMAGCMAFGAAGVWTGSIWLSTIESEMSEAFRDKMVGARSRDTVRSKARTGKYSRQLRSSWHDAWESAESPGALPMPLMNRLSIPAFAAIEKSVAGGNTAARDLISHFVGQGVGLVDGVRSVASVVGEFKEDFVEATLGLQALLEE
jgi:NAD(P)H-dependent flavin oxidoreductase YrpB (nitropropane dioxygenase family)